MDVKQEINPKVLLFTLPHSLSESSENLTYITYKSHSGARGRYRLNGLGMNTAQDVTDITCVSYVLTDLAKFKGLLIKIKVIKGFSAKLKVLKDCNQIKGF